MGKKLETFKGILGFGVSLGAGLIVGNVVGLTTPANTRTLPKVLIKLGTFGIAGYVGEKAAEYTNETIDDVAAVFGVAKQMKENVTVVVNSFSTDDKPADNK